jgi:hypothetical protein
MCEIVSLSQYRLAKRIVAVRELSRKWIGPRFFDLEEYDWFMVPPDCGGSDLLYIKIDDHSALPWTRAGEVVPGTFVFVGDPLRFCIDMPVLEYHG